MLQSESDRKESQNAYFVQQQEQMGQERAQVESEIVKLQSQIQAFDIQVSQAIKNQADFESLQSQFEVETVKVNAEMSQRQRDHERLSNHVTKVGQEIGDIEAICQMMANERETILKREEGLLGEHKYINELTAQIEAAKQKLDIKRAELVELDTDLQKIENDLQKGDTQIDEDEVRLDGVLDKAVEEKNGLKQELQEMEKRLETAKRQGFVLNRNQLMDSIEQLEVRQQS